MRIGMLAAAVAAMQPPDEVPLPEDLKLPDFLGPDARGELREVDGRRVLVIRGGGNGAVLAELSSRIAGELAFLEERPQLLALNPQVDNVGVETMPALGEESSPIPSRPVTVGEVAEYRKKGHNACSGQGYLVMVKGVGPKAERRGMPCRCAAMRFLKKQGKNVEHRENGDVHWLPGKAPAAAAS